MGAWGFGLFQSDRDYDIVAELSDEAGLDQLRASVASKLRAAAPEAQHNALNEQDIYLTIYAETCDDRDTVREHLDSGILDTLFAAKQHAMDHPVEYAYPDPGYVFCLLGACAMTLGCHIDERYLVKIQAEFLDVGMMEEAEIQLWSAMHGPNGFVDGRPYDFESLNLRDTAHAKRYDERERTPGGWFGLNVPSPGGLRLGPPKNQASRLAMMESKFGPEKCGGCGACATSVDGGSLLSCARCGRRKYCSPACQKAHWSTHRPICKARTGVVAK